LLGRHFWSGANVGLEQRFERLDALLEGMEPAFDRGFHPDSSPAQFIASLL